MSWTDDYLPPFINPEKLNYNKIKELIKDVSFALNHSLRFHESLKDAKIKLPEINETSDLLYTNSQEIYDSSLQRIEKLEDKSFKLLSYYTILLGFISFVIIQSSFTFITQIIIVISVIFALWSVIISFRCINIKGISQKYLSDIYDFNSIPPKVSFSREKIILVHLNSASKNDRISDNIVDLHNAARYCLSIAFIVFFIGAILAISKGELLSKPKSDEIYLLKTDLNSIEKIIQKQNQIIFNNQKMLNKNDDSLSFKTNDKRIPKNKINK